MTDKYTTLEAEANDAPEYATNMVLRRTTVLGLISELRALRGLADELAFLLHGMTYEQAIQNLTLTGYMGSSQTVKWQANEVADIFGVPLEKVMQDAGMKV